MKRFVTFLGLVLLCSSLSHAAVTINIVESGGNVVATATGSLDLSGLSVVGSDPFENNRGIIQGSNAAPGDTDSVLWVGGGQGVTLYQISTDFIFSDNAAAVVANNNSGDVIGIINKNPNGTFTDHLRITTSYVSGDPVNSSSTWLGHTINSLGLLTGTYNITWAADSISINVVAAPPSTYSVEGTVSGLTALGLVLQINGGDDLDVFTNGNFFFSGTMLDDGSAYAVTVLTHPTGQTCSVTNGSGTISGANVTDVIVNCADDQVATYTIGGTVSGLGNDFTLLNNGGDALTITSDGSFTFDTAVPEGDLYAVSVDASSLDPSDSCSVTNGNGTIGTADVTNVAVTCERVFQLGGIISGVTSGGSITLQNNGGDNVTWNENVIDSYRFPTRLPEGATYNVTVLTPPTGQTCTVANATGTMSNSNFVDVNVTCVDDVVPTYSVGGTVSGLTGTGLALQNNGADTLPIATDGPFTFVTDLVDTTAYAVTVSTQPMGQTCSVTNGSGNIPAADVTNVGVACEDDVAPPVEPPPPATPIPTTSQWALIMLSMLLGLMVLANRRRLF